MSNNPTERQATDKGARLIYSMFDSWNDSVAAGKKQAAYADRKRYAELKNIDIDSEKALMFSAFIGGMQAALVLVERLDSSDTAEDQTAATAET